MVGLIVVFCATNIHLKINYSDAVTPVSYTHLTLPTNREV